MLHNDVAVLSAVSSGPLKLLQFLERLADLAAEQLLLVLCVHDVAGSNQRRCKSKVLNLFEELPGTCANGFWKLWSGMCRLRMNHQSHCQQHRPYRNLQKRFPNIRKREDIVKIVLLKRTFVRTLSGCDDMLVIRVIRLRNCNCCLHTYATSPLRMPSNFFRWS